MTGIIPEDEQLALKFFRVTDMVGTGNKYLFDIRFHGQGGRSDSVRIHRDFPVTEYFQAQLICGPVKNIPAFLFEHYIPGEENHSHPIFTIGRQMEPQLDTFVKEEFMRDRKSTRLNSSHDQI